MNINFSFETTYGYYNDVLILEDNHTYSDAEIEIMKQERLNNWLTVFEPSV